MPEITPETGVVDLRQDPNLNSNGTPVPTNEVVHAATELTHEQARALCQMSYIDWTHLGIDVAGENLTTREALGRARSILEEQFDPDPGRRDENFIPFPPENGGMSPKDYQDFISRILENEGGRYDEMLGLVITGHQSVRPTADSPPQISMVLTALTDGDGNTIILSTGTEGAFDQHMTGTPGFLCPVWLSNQSLFLGGRGDEATRRLVEAFARYHGEKESGAMLFLGHSRGYQLSGWGALAMWGTERDISVIGINGFGPEVALTPLERAILNMIAINHVTRRDPSANAGPNFGNHRFFAHTNAMPRWIFDEGQWVNSVLRPQWHGFSSHYIMAIFAENGFFFETTQSWLPYLKQNLLQLLIERNPDYLSSFVSRIDDFLDSLEQQWLDSKKDLRYVVKGAKIKCSRGLRTSKLLMPRTKGVYIHDLPQATENCNKRENGISFAGCSSMHNPYTQKAHAELIASLPESEKSRLERVVWGVLRALGLKDRFLNDDVEISPAFGKCVFETALPWIQPMETVFLGEDKEKALLRRSVLSCIYGGTIRILEDGQLE